MYISSEHIQQWIKTGTAFVVSTEIAAELGEYLNQLPWLPGGSGLDWGQIPGIRADLSTLSECEQIDWLKSTPLGGDPLWVFWYVDNEPGIACDRIFAIQNLDQAFWKAPGKRYIVGAVMNGNDVIEPVREHFAEYDGADTLIVAQ